MLDLTILPNRQIISISGDDKKTFLQGLITNDINQVNNKNAIYSLMLSPQGRFLYDFFIIQKNDTLLLDCNSNKIDEIIQKFSFYKLRSNIKIQKENNLSVAISFHKTATNDKQTISFIDPRNKKMGYRHFITQDNLYKSQQQYNLHRLQLKIPDDSDLTFDKSFPLEFGFDNLNAVNYQKGCYVGQETTARTHYKGIIRKKIFLAEILDCQQIEKSTIVEAENKKIGEILSSVFYNNKLLTLTLIKNLDNEGKEVNLSKLKLIVSDKEMKLIK